MKLIVTGATGLVGSEIIKQSLLLKEITSVVAVARQPITLDQGVDASKLKSVVVKDYSEYSDSVKDEFAEADACIW
jgi:putative NADH-flavin reductase